jgi:hypothetical protein
MTSTFTGIGVALPGVTAGSAAIAARFPLDRTIPIADEAIANAFSKRLGRHLRDGSTAGTG